MYARLQEWIAEQQSIQQSEIPNYTAQQWRDWCSSWDTYVVSGGQRPTHRPPA